MPQHNHHITLQRMLLLSKGYTENMLHVPNQPALFLSTLKTKLQELEREHPESTVAQVFTHRLLADFENGRFPASLDFTYQYKVDAKDLTLLSLEATLFDARLLLSMKSKKNDELMTATELIKTLKEKVRQIILKSSRELKHKNMPSKIRSRSR